MKRPVRAATLSAGGYAKEFARIGFVRGEKESLMDMFAGFLGITPMEPRTRLQRRAAGLPAELASSAFRAPVLLG